MRHRTLALAIALPAALAWSLAVCAGPAPQPQPPVPDAAAAGALQPSMPTRLKLVEADTFRIALRPNAVIGMATVGGGVPLAQTSFSSSDTLVATVVDGAIVARDSGVTTITGTTVAAPAMSGTVVVEVQTAVQAVNDMALEVCPNTSDTAAIRGTPPLTTEHERIHEFHDCQRLIDGRQYSALVGIFAHRNVRLYEDWREYRSGRLVATIVNFVGKDSQAYKPLDLQPGTSCLYLRATSENDWQAAVVPQVQPALQGPRRFYESCTESSGVAVARERWGALQVQPQYGVDMAGDSVAPPVARWDWDETHDHNYMGVKCGTSRWCEIGRPGFVPSVPLTIPVPKLGRANVIKGYYDQQYLASLDGKTPTTVFGTIVPDEDLKKHGKMKHYDVRWHEVAEITLQETANDKTNEYRRYVRQYAGEPLFDALLGKRKQAELELRPDLATGDILRLWVGRLNGKALRDGGIVFHYHRGSHGPPTVRWRWHHDDERTWSYCDPEGCCETTRLLTDS